MKNKTAEALLFKYNNGTASEEEIAWVESWYLKFEDKVPDVDPDQIKTDEEESWAALRLQMAPKSPMVRWKTIGIAAAMLLVGALALIFYEQNHSEASIKTSSVYQNDVPPGQDKAILTLSDGKKMVLFKVKDGIITERNGIRISKTKEGELKYQVHSSSLDHRLIFNTLETPRGGQYRLTLPDGTKVWLNAASTLKYPVSFPNAERSVSLDGEAYFEVKENKDKPFIVHTRHQQVEVLGTHFNINSYDDDLQTKTTLLEGRVKVSLDQFSASKLLKPGEQAIQASEQLYVKQVDAEEAIAWKNGYFQFKDEEIGSIMRKISRWYDVDIDYKKGVNTNETFSGTISRFDQVSKVLEKLELTGVVHFEIEGRRILVKR